MIPNTDNKSTFDGEMVMHNAYLYNDQGETDKKVTLKSGSLVKVLAKKIINGRKFYQIADNYYIAATNISGTDRRLTHNAYLYNKHGKHNVKQTSKKKDLVTTYGAALTSICYT